MYYDAQTADGAIKRAGVILEWVRNGLKSLGLKL